MDIRHVAVPNATPACRHLRCMGERVMMIDLDGDPAGCGSESALGFSVSDKTRSPGAHTSYITTGSTLVIRPFREEPMPIMLTRRARAVKHMGPNLKILFHARNRFHVNGRVGRLFAHSRSLMFDLFRPTHSVAGIVSQFHLLPHCPCPVILL